MPDEVRIKIATAILFTSLGYTTYRVSRGIAWALDKGEQRWKICKAASVNFVRPK
jgi:hypothetical protein